MATASLAPVQTPSYSYEVDNNDRTKKEEGVLNGKPWGLEYDSAGHNFNGYQSVYSAGGGAGYGGGGSGASTSAAAIILTQKWNNNPNGIRQNVGFGQLGGGGVGDLAHVGVDGRQQLLAGHFEHRGPACRAP